MRLALPVGCVGCGSTYRFVESLALGYQHCAYVIQRGCCSSDYVPSSYSQVFPMPTSSQRAARQSGAMQPPVHPSATHEHHSPEFQNTLQEISTQPATQGEAPQADGAVIDQPEPGSHAAQHITCTLHVSRSAGRKDTLFPSVVCGPLRCALRVDPTAAFRWACM